MAHAVRLPPGGHETLGLFFLRAAAVHGFGKMNAYFRVHGACQAVQHVVMGADRKALVFLFHQKRGKIADDPALIFEIGHGRQEETPLLEPGNQTPDAVALGGFSAQGHDVEMVVAALHFALDMLDIRLHAVLLVADKERIEPTHQSKKVCRALGKVEAGPFAVDAVKISVLMPAHDGHDGIVAVLLFAAGRVHKNDAVHTLPEIRRGIPVAQPFPPETLGVLGYGIEQHLTGEVVWSEVLALFHEPFTAEEARLAFSRSVHGGGIFAPDDDAFLEQFGVGVEKVVAGADHAPRSALGPQRVGQAQLFGGFFDLLRIGDVFRRDHVVINQQFEVLADGLALHDTPGLHGHFLGIAAALDQQTVVQAPDRTFLVRLGVEHFRVALLQNVACFQLPLDLGQKALGVGSGVAENADGDFRVAQNVLDGQGHGDDGGLVVLARPEIQVTVRGRRHFLATDKAPVVVRVLAAHEPGEQKEEVGPAQGGHGGHDRLGAVPAGLAQNVGISLSGLVPVNEGNGAAGDH